jgi:PD-(D/E)XK nuclease superfamily
LKDCFEEGLTQSEIMTRMNCPRKWYFRYVLQKKKQGSFSWALLFGDAIHRMLERYYRGADTEAEVPDFRFEEDVILRPDQTEEHKYWRQLAHMIIKEHNKYWFNFDNNMVLLANEEQISYTYRGFKLHGKIDLCIRPTKNDGIFPMDHKTTFMFDAHIFDGWSFRFQFLFYAWLWWKVKGRYPAGVYVNAIRKPAERRSVKRQETIEDLVRRIRTNIRAEPQNYFKRERLPFGRGTLERFEAYTLNPILAQYEMLGGIADCTPNQLEDEDLMDVVNGLLLSMNTDHCHVYNRSCEFLDLCQNNLNDHAAEYITMTKKHPELHK